MIEDLSLVLAFVATLIGVIGKTTRENLSFPRNITWWGWTATGLGVLSLIASLTMKKNADVTRDQYKFWGLRELEFATYKMMYPYWQTTDPPEEGDRYKLAQSLIENGIFEHFLNQRMYDTMRFEDLTYGELASNKVGESVREMGEILSRYSFYFDPELVKDLTELRTDPWTEIMINSKDRMRRSARKTTLVFGSNSNIAPQSLYKVKISVHAAKLKRVEELIGREIERICSDQKLENPAPAFLLPLNR